MGGMGGCQPKKLKLINTNRKKNVNKTRVKEIRKAITGPHISLSCLSKFKHSAFLLFKTKKKRGHVRQRKQWVVDENDKGNQNNI